MTPAVVRHPGIGQPMRQVNKMDHRIPLPFFACTQLHLETYLKYKLPTAAIHLYEWAMRNIPSGAEQEFTKQEYDKYCLQVGKKPPGQRWFNACIEKLIKTRLLKVIYRCQGRWFRIIAYHPWQLDDWLLEDIKKNKKIPKRNEKIPERNEKIPENGSNVDSTVDSCREKKVRKEKQCKDKPKKAVEVNVAAAPKKNNGEKCDFSQGKSEERGFIPQPKVKDQNEDLNASKSNNQQVNQKEKVPPPKIDEKINNKKWRSHLEQLDDLGVRENDTVRKAVKKYSTKRVEDAIALYRQRKREGYVENPNAYFMQALIENWAEENVRQKLDESINPEDKAALFRYWYDLAKELGYCSGVEEREGDLWVLLSGTWEKFTDAWKRGFNLEYLRKTKKMYEGR